LQKKAKKKAKKRSNRRVQKAKPGPSTAVTAEQLAKPAPEVEAAPTDFEPVLCFFGDNDESIWGLDLRERTRKLFAREGVTREIFAPDLKNANGPVILVRADAVIDAPLVAAIAKRPNFLMTGSADGEGDVIAAHFRKSHSDKVIACFEGKTSPSETALIVRRPEDMNTSYWGELRKRESPYAMRLTARNRDAVEWRSFMGTYKGATDLVTKHLWPVPAFYVTRWLAQRGITPNLVTAIGAVLMFAALALFYFGYFATGLVAAWIMTFLDTVDGKLARTTLTSSKWGNVFDHGIDLIHPPFWYLAWQFGLVHWGVTWDATFTNWIVFLIFAGYIAQRVMEGIAIKWLGLQIHVWRPIDTLFRQITARRNPNLILLTLSLFVMKPDWGLIAVAAWTTICLFLHGIQLLQGLAARRAKGAPLQSWMDAR
jgi:phosphatidylglycerophosphate synthase